MMSAWCARLAAVVALAALAACALPGCGARTGLRGGGPEAGSAEDAASDAGDAAADVPLEAPPDVLGECVEDRDCPTVDRCVPRRCIAQRCVDDAPRVCDDGDECTLDRCDPATGDCLSVPVTRDEDGDGFLGPRPGFAPGAPGSCGDDCDDTSPLAYPGGQEACDGVDNDCNGVIDDDARWVPARGEAPVRISSAGLRQSGPGGLVYNGTFYVASYAGQAQRWRTLVQGLDRGGRSVFPETSVTTTSNDTFAGPIVWTGSVFATAWEDRRAGNYEIYFNRLGRDGRKLGADVRVTSADGFSLHPCLLWNGSEYLLFWDDQRGGSPQIVGRRLRADGTPVDQERRLSTPGSESPHVARGSRRLGLAYNFGAAGASDVAFRTFGPDLEDPGDLLRLSTRGGVTPTVVAVEGAFVVVWATRSSVPGDSVWGAVVSESGSLLVEEKRLTTGATFARSPTAVSLGDRVLLVWPDDADGNYELYTQLFSDRLEPLSTRQRITRDPADSVEPRAAFGPDGDVGVLFSDRRSGSFQTYFTRLTCVAGK